jgi:hypothetical protein
LVSALLNDTTTMEQLVTGNAQPRISTQPTAFVPEMVDRFNTQFAQNPISRANNKASEANRQQASSVRGKPSTAFHPKTTARQRKGTVRHRRQSRGSGGTAQQQPVHRPAGEILDGFSLSRTMPDQPATVAGKASMQRVKLPELRDYDVNTRTFKNMPKANRQSASVFDLTDATDPPATVAGKAEMQRVKLPELRDYDLNTRTFRNMPKANRQSASILDLTDALKIGPQEITEVRRSKTTRDTGKSGLAKQKGVFKKMTNALADRLHLTSKPETETQIETEEDRVRGAGYYDYETDQFIRNVVADVPTQKRQVTSRLTEVYDRRKSDIEIQSTIAGSVEEKFGRRNTMSSISPESLGDPFSERDSMARAPTDFVNRLKNPVTQTVQDPVPTTPMANRFEIENVLRGSINSLLPLTPIAASTPRISIDRARNRGYTGRLKVSQPEAGGSGSEIGLCANLELFDIGTDESSDEDTDDDMPSSGHFLAPVHGYTYLPVLNARDRKKHPSPNKIDLEFLESRLREKWPETLEGTAELTKKHPSPLNVDIQALGEQFRQAYPGLLGGNTLDQTGDSINSIAVAEKDDDTETDELALSFALSTSAQPAISRHGKALSVGFSRIGAVDAKGKHQTMSVAKCGDLLNPSGQIKFSCPAYHQA